MAELLELPLHHSLVVLQICQTHRLWSSTSSYAHYRQSKMPDDPTPMEKALADRQPAQTDTAISKALQLIKDGDRPTVPIRTYDDPNRLYEEVLKAQGGPPLTDGAVGVVPVDKSAIYINSKSTEYQNPYMLASKLMHE